MLEPWDYLLVTASHDAQARAYDAQLTLRRRLGLLPDIGHAMVVADPGGKRIGSGGSTIFCLMKVLERELSGEALADPAAWEAVLRRRRILIIHAGGDSRRLPAYGPCGKIFVPVPGESDSALTPTLFDRLLPTFLRLPAGLPDAGQVVVTSGDALIRFDPERVQLARPGMVALGSPATPEAASKHGVFVNGPEGRVRLYLQKPRPSEQQALGAVDRYGQSVLDIGVMSFDGAFGATLLCGVETAAQGRCLGWSDSMKALILQKGLDLYREICCAMGAEATPAHHLKSARESGSAWDEASLLRLFERLHSLPFFLDVLPQSHFLHFGTTRQVITSGWDLWQQDRGVVQPGAPLSLNNDCRPGGEIVGANAWVEGCRLSALLTLDGWNVVVGVDVVSPLRLPVGTCLDVIRGRTPASRGGRAVWFARCYGIADTFKDTGEKATFGGMPVSRWLAAVGVTPEDLWDASIPPDQRTLWDACLFPAIDSPTGYRDWLWMLNPVEASGVQKAAFLAAERYSAAQISLLADQDDFYERRMAIRAEELRRSLRRMYRVESNFSAEELAFVLRQAIDRTSWVATLLQDARLHFADHTSGSGLETFAFCRILHSLGSAVEILAGDAAPPLEELFPGMGKKLSADICDWLDALGLAPRQGQSAADWGRLARDAAFSRMNQVILRSSLSRVGHPKNHLRSDETIWGRAPCRLELGGGWTDTPPYTLEHGGSVANTAINLNGQPPIHVYARVVNEPVIRLTSIDTGQRLEIRSLDRLLDYRDPRDSFGLIKAALAISGFSPDMADWPASVTLQAMLEAFGGGIELTTLVGIPKGSGLGTSSVIGATLVAVLHRMMGRPLTRRELFHHVLRLEQALTTGGGWQDQIGGGIGGTKITTTRPGLFPNPSIRYVPDDLLDPQQNGGSTLLYYTGITRLAKNILEQIVGGYFNRNRRIMTALAHEHEVARAIAEAMAGKDAAAFAKAINVAWRLQQELCSDVTNPQINELLERLKGRIEGARLLGAGSGGFMLMLARSPADAAAIRQELEQRPLNDRARFFNYSINHAGLEVTTC